MKNKAKLKNKYSDGNSIGVLGIIISVGIYFQFIQNAFWSTADLIVYDNLKYFVFIFCIRILSLTFWIMSLGYILINFYRSQETIKK